jgi:hypothetical protein
MTEPATESRFRVNPKSLIGGLAVILLAGCNDPVRPEQELPIVGYTISGQANGTDSVTGEQLACVFLLTEIHTGGPLVGSWSDTATVLVTRLRADQSQRVQYDTTIAGQQVTLTIADSAHVQLVVSGPFTENLTADLDPNYPGWGVGDWTCGPGHPLGRVQPDAVLTGQWRIQPVLDLPIG